MFCEKCGKTISPEFNVCMYCGYIIESDEENTSKTQFGKNEFADSVSVRDEKKVNVKPVEHIVPDMNYVKAHQAQLKQNNIQQNFSESMPPIAPKKQTDSKKIITAVIASVVAVVIAVSSFVVGNITASKSLIVLVKDSEDVVAEEEETTKEKIGFNFSFGKTPLKEVSVLESDHYEYVQNEYVDALGNSFNQLHKFDTYYYGLRGGYSVFYLDGNYKKLTGTIVADAGVDLGSSQSICIYADDVLIYEQYGINRGTDPIDFSVDVRNCRLLKIQIGACGTIRIANAQLS